jgi:hypothetical protein
MSQFIENEAAPIVSTLLRQGLIPDYSEALSLIDQSEIRTSGDAKWALGATGIGVASSLGILALSGITAPIIIPIGAALGCLATAWNSRQTEIDRQRESEFLGSFPGVLDLIEAKADGSNDARVAAAYEQSLKSYRYGELDNIERFIGGTKAVTLQDIPIDDSPIADPVAAVPTVVQPQTTPVALAAPVAGLPGFIAEMAHNVRSSLIVGIPGAGKGLTVANLISKVRHYRPELQIFGTDPKNDPKESGYWQGYTAIDRFDMERLDRWEIESRLSDDLNRFLDAGDNALWVIDEFATLIGMVDKKWLDKFTAKIQAIVQMGNSRNRYVWIVSQSGNLSELKLQPSLRSSLELLAIVRPGSDAAVAGLIRTDLIADKDTTRMQAMIDRSPVARAYYYGKAGQWAAMPTLPNLSGYDRDSRRWEPGFVPVEPPTETTEFDVAAVDRALGHEPWEGKANPKLKPKLNPATLPDPVMEVIGTQPEGEHKDGLKRAYQWYLNRQRKNKPVTLEDFVKAVERKGSGMESIKNAVGIFNDLIHLIS